MNEKIIIPNEAKQKLIVLGRARNAAKHPSWTRRKSDVFDDEQVDILGCWGEWAASDFFGLEMDWNVHPHGDGGSDLRLSDGRSISVKYSHRMDSALIVEERAEDTDEWLKEFQTDLACLVHGTCDMPGHCICHQLFVNDEDVEVWFRGGLRRESFLKKKQRVDWGLGGRYIVRCHLLNRFVKRCQ